MRFDCERALDFDRVRDLDLLLEGRTWVSSEIDATVLEDLALDVALEDDRRDGAIDEERPLDETTDAEACVIALPSPAGCLDLDLALLLLAIESDLPLEDTNSVRSF